MIEVLSDSCLIVLYSKAEIKSVKRRSVQISNYPRFPMAVSFHTTPKLFLKRRLCMNMYKQSITDGSFFVWNTDSKSLETSSMHVDSCNIQSSQVHAIYLFLVQTDILNFTSRNKSLYGSPIRSVALTIDVCNGKHTHRFVSVERRTLQY